MQRTIRVLIAVLMLFALSAASAQQPLKLTIASSHPTTLPWVGLMSTVFVPDVNRRLDALKKGYRIEWREAYGGQLYKANATLTSISENITDIGWVLHILEGSKLPLAQVTGYAPGVSDDPRLVMAVMNDLNESVPALKAEWEKNNVVFLGATAGDTYQLFTKAPVKSIADLRGRKISAPGVLGSWLRGTGATALEGALTTYYTDLQTGLSEGVITNATGAYTVKVFEVAPIMSRAALGSTYYGAIAINKDVWVKLPPEIQGAMKEAGREYSRALGEEVLKRYEAALSGMAAAKQTPPVQIVEWSVTQRREWLGALPNIAQDWVKTNEAKGLPAAAVLRAYMDDARKRGATPLRDWDKP